MKKGKKVLATLLVAAITIVSVNAVTFGTENADLDGYGYIGFEAMINLFCPVANPISIFPLPIPPNTGSFPVFGSPGNPFPFPIP